MSYDVLIQTETSYAMRLRTGDLLLGVGRVTRPPVVRADSSGTVDVEIDGVTHQYALLESVPVASPRPQA